MQYATARHLSSLATDFVLDTPLPAGLNYCYQLGSVLAVAMLAQIASGIFLAFFYLPSIDLAFASCEYILRDVNAGWLVRYLHANG